MEELIRNISLSKEEERKLNIPRYQALFVPNSYYSNMVLKEREILTNERKIYSTDEEFYTSVARQFAKQFIPLIIGDYQNQLDEETIAKLGNIMNGDGLRVFLPGQAVLEGYIPVDSNGNPKGDDGAFAISKIGMIGFTPSSSNSKSESEVDVITNALRMKSSMIHETFHLLIDVLMEETFLWISGGTKNSQLTSGGFILNEGLVEKYATEFSRRHGLIHNPALDYFHYVDLCVALENKVGKENFKRLVFQNSYKRILESTLTPEQINLYQFHERKKYLEKRKITDVDFIVLDSKEEVSIKKI